MNREIDVNTPISTIIKTGTVIFVSHRIKFFLLHHFSAAVSSRAQSSGLYTIITYLISHNFIV